MKSIQARVLEQSNPVYKGWLLSIERKKRLLLGHFQCTDNERTALPQLERQTAAATPMYPRLDAHEGHWLTSRAGDWSTILLLLLLLPL
jgi:hypothetical protein